MRGLMSTVPPTERPPDSVAPKLLEILVCPVTKGPLEYDAERHELVSRKAKLAYPIRDGIPIMMPEEERRLQHEARGFPPSSPPLVPANPLRRAVSQKISGSESQ